MIYIILLLIGTQVLFTISDLMARFYMTRLGYHLSSFIHPWFFGYFFVRQIAMFGQLYIFSQVQLGKTSAMFGAASIVISNALGFLVLREVLSPITYIGIMLAVTAILAMAFK